VPKGRGMPCDLEKMKLNKGTRLGGGLTSLRGYFLIVEL